LSEQEALTVVLGVGNELYRDEGVGVVVARQLALEELPPEVRVVEGALGGINLLFEMEGASLVIVLDAVDMGLPPGTVRAFTPEEVEVVPPAMVASLHQVGLGQVLELGQLIGVRPRVHIVGIQPEAVAPGFDLTDTVTQAIPEALRTVRRLLAEPVAPGQ
jgi:hydrogenase maturation protease